MGIDGDVRVWSRVYADGDLLEQIKRVCSWWKPLEEASRGESGTF